MKKDAEERSKREQQLKADLEKTKEGNKNEVLELFDRIKTEMEKMRKDHSELSAMLELENEKRMKEAELIRAKLEREKQELRDYLNEDNKAMKEKLDQESKKMEEENK
jgi:hypothetical protein